jgi:hypothetical protein
MLRTALAAGFALAGLGATVVAVFNERRMHRHRQPGVSYGAATFRRDGGWRRTDLFTSDGLRYQREAARWGWTGALLWILALVALVILK